MTLTKADYQHLYRITSLVTPLDRDCGTLCGRACCKPGQRDELGIYLFPGEECMFTRQENWLLWEEQDPREYEFPASWPHPVYFIRCTGPCPRRVRPLACRFFPLAPHLQQDGSLLLIYETLQLPYSCPLIHQTLPLQRDFITTTGAAWDILLRDHRIRDLVEEDSRDREQQGFPLRLAVD